MDDIINYNTLNLKNAKVQMDNYTFWKYQLKSLN